MAESKTPSINAEQLITEHLDIWTTGIEQKSSSGRGSSKKFSLHGIKKLRELILELAVRGKLVPQDPNDEPASVLLERIAAEKAQLVKDKKIKKPKALPEISEGEKPFEVPEGWEWCRVADIASLISGKGFKKSEYKETGARLFQIANVSLGYTKWEIENYLPISYLDEYPELKLKVGDILIALNRPLLNNLMKACILGREDLPAVLYQRVGKFNFYNDLIYKKYFYFYLHSPLFINKLKESLQGSDQPFINQTQLIQFPLSIPPVKEQQRIVAKVDELMSLCDALEAQTESSITAHQTLVEVLLEALLKAPEQTATPEQATKQFQQNWQRLNEHFDTLFTTTASIDTLKQTILQLAVMGKLVPQNSNDEPAAKLLERIAAEKAQLIKDKKIKKQKPLPEITDEEKPFELPDSWVWSQVGEVCSIGPRNNLNDELDVSFVPMPLISTSYDGRHGQEVRKWGEIKKGYTHFTNGDIALAKITPCFENSKAAVFADLKNGFGAGTTELHVARPINDMVNRLFILLYLKSPMFLEVGKTKMTGSAGQKRIPNDFFSGNPLPLPPLEEQQRIVAKVDELMTLCDQLKASLTDAQTTKLHLTDAIVEQTL